MTGPHPVKREVLPDGRLRLSAGGCTFLYKRLRPGALLVTVSGDDRGDFGTATLDEIRLELTRASPLELLVDARAAVGAAVGVTEEWTQFFSKHREHLKRVSVLVGSKVMGLTVEISQHLSRTGNLIQTFRDAAEFEARVAEVARRS